MVHAAGRAARREAGGGGDERHFGEHSAWVEEPDVFVMRLVGRLEGAELEAMLDWYAAWQRGRAECCVLVDVTRLKTLSPAAREVANVRRRNGGSAPVTACFGASYTIRVIADMVMRARRILGNASGAATPIFATEAEARAYLASRAGVQRSA
ncbi:hypothetical protein [Polyangium aurulentum]|uniref:hypothetical protein n=1 Tax=Polyangium aurulentum TaxID=2567896 RepID=UPI0010AEDD80|nr:hypothetical protein [Polyangium aurulentum]UQA55003.1 hypothetical protein E8A73_027010 [Polyangium aurulentum]